MRCQYLGTTDLQVTRLGLGTVELGLPYGIGLSDPPSDAECIRILQHALDAGINYFDTAAAYGRSEELVGRAFGTHQARPVIATKVLLQDSEETAAQRGASLRRQLEESAVRSLETLRVDSLDLLQIHNAQGSLMVPEVVAAMDDLCARGLVRYWGASTYGLSHSLEILDSPANFRSLQAAYNLLDTRLGSEVFRRCRESGVGPILRSVLLKGILTDRASELPGHLDDLRRESARATQIAADAGMSLPEMALRFAAFCPWADVTLFGAVDVGETEANIAAIERGPLPADLTEQLKGLRVNDEELLNPVYTTPGWPASPPS